MVIHMWAKGSHIDSVKEQNILNKLILESVLLLVKFILNFLSFSHEVNIFKKKYSLLRAPDWLSLEEDVTLDLWIVSLNPTLDVEII